MDEQDPLADPVLDADAEVDRAMGSLVETLRSIPELRRRSALTHDDALAEVLSRQVDGQREIVAMLIEWLRQHDPALDTHLRAYLFQRTADEAASPPVEAPAPITLGSTAPAAPPARGTALTLNPSSRIRG